MTSPTCDHCGRLVDPNDGRSGQRIVAYEVRSVDPARKHGRDVVLREHMNLWACGVCIDRLRSGLSVNQEALNL